MAAQMQQGNAGKGNPWRLAVWGTAAGLLSVPAIAMQLGVEGVHWTAFDFVVMGVLLGSACAAYEVAVRMSGNSAYRLGFALAIVLGFLLVWINLAVGIIGSEDDMANVVFAAVLLVGAIGALLGQLQAAGMARAMVATGIAQSLAGGYALALGSKEGVLLSVAFAALWFTSAALFRKAALQ
ncbi:MAG TPA: hypothetical protein VLC71_11155 [Thermomonas sp.]|nr:hypothetical protein [Thermomonas sp.]